MQDAYLLFYLQTAFFNLFLTIRLYSGTKIRKTTAAVQRGTRRKTMAKKIFKRYELKYLMSGQQAEKLRRIMQQHMRPDEYGRSRVGSIYFDTEDHLLIRRSIERPMYKEKLRIRYYGDRTDLSQMFLELKKKYDHVVYKRRLTVEEYLTAGCQEQITKEVRYFTELYRGLGPAAHISCDREAWFAKDDPDFRMTFDRDIRYKEYGRMEFSGMRMDSQSAQNAWQAVPDNRIWPAGYYLPEGKGRAILPADTVLLEVKTAMGMPRWLLDFLDEEQIYKQRFSKYGIGYTQSLMEQSNRLAASLKARIEEERLEAQEAAGAARRNLHKRRNWLGESPVMQEGA